MIAKGLYTHKIKDYIITCATEEEKRALVPERFWCNVVITGIGFLDTIMTLKEHISDSDMFGYEPRFVINIGYAGAKDIPVGTICRVNKCSAYREHDLDTGAMQLYEFKTSAPSYLCYSATDFIEGSNLEGPFLVDMELLAHSILSCPLASIKIVSDNMSMDDYTSSLKSDYKDAVNEILLELGVE